VKKKSGRIFWKFGIDTLDERIEFQFKPKRTYKKRQVNIKEQLDLTY
jgi:hypothetical protein